MKEEKIIVRIGSDGSMRAETKGLKGRRCQTEIEALLSDLAAINEVTLTSEAKEKEDEAHVRATQSLGKNKS